MCVCVLILCRGRVHSSAFRGFNKERTRMRLLIKVLIIDNVNKSECLYEDLCRFLRGDS